MTNAELTKRLERDHGQTWCFIHQEPWPCVVCEAAKKAHPFTGMCFDCKMEFAQDGEENVRHCSCGSTVRLHSFYDYFTLKFKG